MISSKIFTNFELKICISDMSRPKCFIYFVYYNSLSQKIIHEDLTQFKIFVNCNNFICLIFDLKMFQHSQIKICPREQNISILSNCILLLTTDNTYCNTYWFWFDIILKQNFSSYSMPKCLTWFVFLRVFL